MQHLFVVYLQESGSLAFFSAVDSGAAQSDRDALASGQTGQCLALLFLPIAPPSLRFGLSCCLGRPIGGHRPSFDEPREAIDRPTDCRGRSDEDHCSGYSLVVFLLDVVALDSNTHAESTVGHVKAQLERG